MSLEVFHITTKESLPFIIEWWIKTSYKCFSN